MTSKEEKREKTLFFLNLVEAPMKCLKHCSLCDAKVQPFDVVVEYVDDVFQGRIKMRYVHLECWLSRQEPRVVEGFLRRVSAEKLAYKRLVLEV